MSDSHEKKTLRLDDVRIPPGSIWARMPLICGVVGLVGLVLAVVLGGSQSEEFFASYLVAIVFFASIGLGGLFFVLVHYAARAGWSVVVRRLAENAAFALPVIAILFLPLLFTGVDKLYHWAHFEHDLHEAEARYGEAGEGGSEPEAGRESEGIVAEANAEGEAVGELEAVELAGEANEDLSGLTPEQIRERDPVLAGKLAYLNTGFWRVRAVLYLAVWSLLAWYFRRRSVTQDREGDKRTTRRLQILSAPGIILFALTATFAAFDWMMSLNPHWYSTIYGVYFFAGCVLAIYAFLSVISIALRSSGLLEDVITTEHYHDLGKMLFAFTVFWTYIAFSQYMLIWYANLPEETVFFRTRWVGSWKTVSLVMALGHFAVPFLFLMSRHIKRRPALLLSGAIWMLLMQYVDLYWLVMPNFYESGPAFGLVDVLLIVGIGGIFMAAFTWYLKKDNMVPVKDPRLPESLAFENF